MKISKLIHLTSNKCFQLLAMHGMGNSISKTQDKNRSNSTTEQQAISASLFSANQRKSTSQVPLPSSNKLNVPPSHVQKVLETESRWGFDVILLEEITEKRPLLWTGLTIFPKFFMSQRLHCDEPTLRNWLNLIEANYHSRNPYHNSTHAADVLQATAYFMSKEKLHSYLGSLDEVACLIAAIVHDVDHPGKTSGFLVNTKDELALLYNDLAVLESHHASFAFKLSLSDPTVNIFKNLDVESYKIVRRNIIDMVLATEMSKHFEFLSKFVTIINKPNSRRHSITSTASVSDPLHSTRTKNTPDKSPENLICIRRMLIKCADVSNPARPLKLCINWAKRISEEYFLQTEEEITRGLPVIMSTFERKSCSIPKSQTNFVDFFITELYSAWNSFLEIPEVMKHMKENYEFWKELDRRGIKTLIEIENYIRKQPDPK